MPVDAVDHVVDEVHPAFVVEVVLVDQLERHLNAGVAAGDVLSAVFGKTLVAQIRGLIEGEFETDRIGRHDGGEQRRVAARAAGDQVARRHAAVADAAVDRRAQLGELQVELGLPHRRLVRRHRRLGVALGLRALLERLLGDGLVAHELPARAYSRLR